MNNLKEIAKEIRDILEIKRQSLGLTFEEEDHIYTMVDSDGVLRNDYPSVSKLVGIFHPEFQSNEIALRMSRGDSDAAEKLLLEWEKKGEYATNMGSRVHYIMEKEIVSKFDLNKEVRQPIFDCDFAQIVKSDSMVLAGCKYLDLMTKRGAYILDTEIVLGHPDLGYVGQPDKMWIIENNGDIGIICTDWKTNKPSKFQIETYTGKMYRPFDDLPDNALGHYSIQLPFYCRLLMKMLEGTKYENLKLYGCIIVLVKDDGNFEEFRVSKETIKKVFDLDIKNILSIKNLF